MSINARHSSAKDVETNVNVKLRSIPTKISLGFWKAWFVSQWPWPHPISRLMRSLWLAFESRTVSWRIWLMRRPTLSFLCPAVKNWFRNSSVMTDDSYFGLLALASNTISTLMSEGLTPEIRDAWASDSGRTRLSFSALSERNPGRPW